MKKLLSINPDLSVEELVETYPEAINFLADNGLYCIVCGEPFWGTIKQLAEQKKLNNIDEIIQKLIVFIESLPDR